MHRLTQPTQQIDNISLQGCNVTCVACEAVVTNHGKQDRWQYPLFHQGRRGAAYRSSAARPVLGSFGLHAAQSSQSQENAEPSCHVITLDKLLEQSGVQGAGAVLSDIKSEQAGHTVKLLRLRNNGQASGQRQEANSGLHGGQRTQQAL